VTVMFVSEFSSKVRSKWFIAKNWVTTQFF